MSAESNPVVETVIAESVRSGAARRNHQPD